MRIGDKIWASSGPIKLHGVIITGFSDRTHDFVSTHGALIDPAEAIVIKLDRPDTERVRIKPDIWDWECVECRQAA